MIIALDGPDGAGKSTQLAHLTGWARDTGRTVRTVGKWELLDSGLVPSARFLRGTDRPELGRCIAEMPSPARMMFLAWMNAVTAERARLAREDLVVIDGYGIKHAASELVLGCPSDLVSCVTEATASVDLIVLLDVDPDEALRRKKGDLTPYECGTDLTCCPDRFLDHQAATRAIMLDWATLHGWPVVEAGPPGTVGRRVIDLIVQALAGPGSDSGRAPSRRTESRDA